MRVGTSPLYRVGRARPLEAAELIGMNRSLVRARAGALEHLSTVGGGRILEVACGSGPLLADLAHIAGPDGLVVGVDASAPLLREAERRTRLLGNVRLRQMEWPGELEEGPFDGAVCCLGLSVIPDWEAALATVVAAVRPGGPVALVDWLVEPADVAPLRAYVRLGSWVAGADPDRPIAARARELMADVRTERFTACVWLVTGRAA